MPPEAEGGGTLEGPPWDELKPIEAAAIGAVDGGNWCIAEVGGA